MRLDVNSNGDPRQLKETLKVIFDNRQVGDLLMDVEETNWTALEKAAEDGDSWWARVHVLKNMVRATTKARKAKKKAISTTHQVQSQRFTFVPPTAKQQPTKKPKKPKLKNQQTLLQLPTWKAAAAAVFSDSDSDIASLNDDSTDQHDSNADFQPHCGSFRQLRPYFRQPDPTTAVTMTTPTPPSTTSMPIMTPSCHNADDETNPDANDSSANSKDNKRKHPLPIWKRFGRLRHLHKRPTPVTPDPATPTPKGENETGATTTFGRRQHSLHQPPTTTNPIATPTTSTAMTTNTTTTPATTTDKSLPIWA